MEKKYGNVLVIIGVHTPKFDNEKGLNAVRKAMMRYKIDHPVVNDADRKIWNAYGIQSWPSLVLIDPGEADAQAGRPARQPGRIVAPELDGGTGWLGTDRPLTLRGLRGKIVILEFWTSC